jgi:hypothetical protein
VPIDPALTRRLDETSDRLNQHSEDLQDQAEQPASPTPTPSQ